jgi:hypothetical protein
MKKTVIALALAAATLGNAQAQQTQHQAAEPQRLFGVVGAGLTYGGDRLATATYTDGGSVTLHAGSLLALLAGVDFRVNKDFSMQGTVGFHVDDAGAKNGSIKFQRFPIELLAYYHPNAQWRVGAGARYASSPKLKGSGVGSGVYGKFDNAVGAIVEAEYFYSERMGVKMRVVSEKYKFAYTGESVDGNHVGLLANFYF